MGVLAVVVWLLALGSAVALTVRVNRVRATAAAFVFGAQAHDALEAAFLAGGPGRVTDTVLVAMCQDGRLRVAEPGIVAVQRPEARHPVEQAVLSAHAGAPSGSLYWVRTTVMRGPEVQALGDALARRGLLVAPAALRPLRRWARLHTLGCFLALPASVLVTVLQYAGSGGSSFPVPFLVAVLPALVIGVFLGLVATVRARGALSAAGRQLLRSYATSGAALVDPVATVAVRGPRALPDPTLRTVLTSAVRQGARGGSSRSATHVPPSFEVSVSWCGGDGNGCGGSSCGGSSGSSCGGSGGSSCGGGSGCGGGGGGGGGGGCGGGG